MWCEDLVKKSMGGSLKMGLSTARPRTAVQEAAVRAGSAPRTTVLPQKSTVEIAPPLFFILHCPNEQAIL